MIICKTPEEFRKQRSHLSGSMGFVPTMGALHQGHLSLVERSLSENDHTAVSIYLNPTQFNNSSDLENYPVSLQEDLKQLEQAGTDIVFLPTYKSMYPDNYNYRIIEKELSGKLCGAKRPGHFDGVLTVVMKFLMIVQADRAYFGEKDYQQYLLIKGMTEAFFIPTEIIPCSLIREEDGLAMSSRNRRLTPEQRELAPIFHRELASGSVPDEIVSRLQKAGFKVDYIEKYKNRLFGAVYIGEVRLIDNVPQ